MTLASSKRRFRCPVCERTVGRKSRTQTYCSAKCMRKGNYARKAGSGLLLGQDTALIPTPHKSSNENNVLRWPRSASSLSRNGPLNLLVGVIWARTRNLLLTTLIHGCAVVMVGVADFAVNWNWS